MKLIYTAQSKRDFFCRDAVCAFVLSLGEVPLNPFRVFDYFLGGRVSEDVVRSANRMLIERSDEVWAFGQTLANGVIAELELAIHLGKPIQLYTIGYTAEGIRGIDWSSLDLEPEVLATGLSRDEVVKQFRRES